MPWLKTAVKIALLSALAFVLALIVGLTPVPDSYGLALAVSVALCPAVLGFVGARPLALGAAATLAGINFLPVFVALEQRLDRGEPLRAGWLALSVVFAWAGWRLGRRAPANSL